ncbi:MAG: hypothetical protein DRP74_05785 [Candidatus Omnitrophota bacterium]|nr:MAG: hypothetical protein DRP74_05785 [Candidatus Omnitrophota bacterium]
MSENKMTRNGFAVASLVVGIISFFSFAGMEKAIVAVIFGILALKSLGEEDDAASKKFAKAGIILGAVSFFLTTILIINYLPKIKEQLRQQNSEKKPAIIEEPQDLIPQPK